MSKSADHLAHGRQTFTLNDLLLQLLFHRDVAYRNDHAAHFTFCIKERAGRSAHGPPTSIAVASATLAGAELLPARYQVADQHQQVSRVVLARLDLLLQQFFRCKAQQIVHTGTHKAVAFIEIDYQDQVRETLEQVALKLLLTP